MGEVVQFVPASKLHQPTLGELYQKATVDIARRRIRREIDQAFADTAPSELPFHPAGTADQHGVPYAAEDDGDCA